MYLSNVEAIFNFQNYVSSRQQKIILLTIVLTFPPT